MIITRDEPPDCCIESKGSRTKARPQLLAVMLASHFPLSNKGEISIAKADRNAMVTKVSAIPPLHTTEPLDLHKQQE